VLLHCRAIRFFHVLPIFHHLDARNSSALYLCQNTLEMAGIRALSFLVKQTGGCFLRIGRDIPRFVNRPIVQKFLTEGRCALLKFIVGCIRV
jgi:hypothetical protein